VRGCHIISSINSILIRYKKAYLLNFLDIGCWSIEMPNIIISGELDDEEYTVPPILPVSLLKKSTKPLVHAIREYRLNLRKTIGKDIGWISAKKDFIEKGYRDYWEYGFKYGCLLKASPNVDPALRLKTDHCQDFLHYINMQIEAITRTMQEIVNRSGRAISADYERELFNIYQAKYWRGGFREGFCMYSCPCHGCKDSFREIFRSEPDAVRRAKFTELESAVSV